MGKTEKGLGRLGPDLFMTHHTYKAGGSKLGMEPCILRMEEGASSQECTSLLKLERQDGCPSEPIERTQASRHLDFWLTRPL